MSVSLIATKGDNTHLIAVAIVMARSEFKKQKEEIIEFLKSVDEYQIKSKFHYCKVINVRVGEKCGVFSYNVF